MYPDNYCLYDSISIKVLTTKGGYYSTKTEAEAALSKYLNSLSPEEFANHTAERILGT